MGADLQEALKNAIADDTGTSNSSVLNGSSSNTGDEESSSTRSARPGFRLGIPKAGSYAVVEVEGEEDFVEEVTNNSSSTAPSSYSQIVTRELFPLATVHRGGNKGGFGQMAPSSSGPESPWVEFSFNQTDLPRQHENRMKQQQAKKSRRGPRSRSSQYRGVTFYRRTGRWESHIWLVHGMTVPISFHPFFWYGVPDERFSPCSGIAGSKCTWVRIFSCSLLLIIPRHPV